MRKDMRKGFIFSLDALASFSLIFAGILALLIFYAYPKLYLFNLLQAKTIASDVLYSAANTYTSDGSSLLGLAITNPSSVQTIIGKRIPPGYEYKLQVYKNGDWDTIYASSEQMKKLAASAYYVIPVIEYQEERGSDPYYYPGFCNGESTVCDSPVSQYYEGKAEVVLVRLEVYV